MLANDGPLFEVRVIATAKNTVAVLRKVEFELGSPARAADFEAVPGARDVMVTDHRVQLSFEGTMDTLLKAVAARYELVDIITQEADLEEIFLAYYQDSQGA